MNKSPNVLISIGLTVFLSTTLHAEVGSANPVSGNQYAPIALCHINPDTAQPGSREYLEIARVCDERRTLHRLAMRMATRIYLQAVRLEQEAGTSAQDRRELKSSAGQVNNEIQALSDVHERYWRLSGSAKTASLKESERQLEGIKEHLRDLQRTVAKEAWAENPNLPVLQEHARTIQTLSEDCFMLHSTLGWKLATQEEPLARASHGRRYANYPVATNKK